MSEETSGLSETPVALTIATSDSGAGAGIQADLRAFAANDVFGISALAALTAQNPEGVHEIQELEPGFLDAQLDQLADFFDIRACKTGMLFNAALIKTTAKFIESKEIPAVVDPVMVASSGAKLLKDDAIETLRERLLPLATLITPNLDEAAVLLDTKITNPIEMRAAARRLAGQFETAVLLKGGHLEGDKLLDVLVLADGEQIEFESERIQKVDTHGSGCTLSAACAAGLAKGLTLGSAVTQAHAYLQRAMNDPVTLNGRWFINHFPAVES